jgi:hypothetical protein
MDKLRRWVISNPVNINSLQLDTRDHWRTCQHKSLRPRRPATRFHCTDLALASSHWRYHQMYVAMPAADDPAHH